MSTNEHLPEELRMRMSLLRGELDRIVARRIEIEADLKALTDAHRERKSHGQVSGKLWTAMKQKREELRQVCSECEEAKVPLAALLKECREYERQVSARSNVAGDLMHLRMPVTRSGCYPHAAGLSGGDDDF